MTYRAPVTEQLATLDLLGLPDLLDGTAFGGLTREDVGGILTEAARFAGEALEPLNRPGDLAGVRYDDGAVTLPEGFRDAYAQWAELGWNGISAPEAYGGAGAPMSVALATYEMWDSACMAFGTGPTLTLGAIELMVDHATDALKDQYLSKMVSGEWMATMNLTEPQAGSDLGALRTRAVPQGDGSYRLFGDKIFITFGEHDLTDNIVHLVLARLPDAPAGTKGISLFLVPKVLPDGTRNDLRCVGVEHKLGIHASPTCAMTYGEDAGAIGWLIGEENRGLACMFTMMNSARLWTAIQGVSIGEAAFQKARDYALERVQGRDPETGQGDAAIIRHPDVRRMLLRMKALTMGARAICYACAVALDAAESLSGDAKAAAMARTAILTPIAKAFASDAGFEAASLGVQVHGGMGYVEETGAAQYLRDGRIPPIYEGTNGIQAIDLVLRKIPQQGGAVVRALFTDLENDIAQCRAGLPDGVEAALRDALGHLRTATDHLLALGTGDRVTPLAVATPYLRLFGLTLAAVLLARGLSREGQGATPLWSPVVLFFAETLLPETAALATDVLAGGRAITQSTPALFERLD